MVDFDNLIELGTSRISVKYSFLRVCKCAGEEQVHHEYLWSHSLGWDFGLNKTWGKQPESQIKASLTLSLPPVPPSCDLAVQVPTTITTGPAPSAIPSASEWTTSLNCEPP